MTLAHIVGSLGGVFQVAGVCLVLWDIADIEKQFQRRPWLASFSDWVTTQLRWLGVRRNTTGSGAVVIPAPALLAIGTTAPRVIVSQGTTLNGRLAAVEAHLDYVDEELRSLRTQLADQQGEAARRVAEVEDRQRHAVASVHQLVKALSADSLLRRLWGVGFIVVGTFLTIVALWL